MKMLPRRRILARVPMVVAIFFVSACAGLLGRISRNGDLPSDLPEEYKEKFALKAADVAPLPEPSPSLVPAAPGQKQGRRHHLRSGRRHGSAKKQTTRKPSPEASPAPAAFQYPNRRPPKDPIWLSEKLIYGVSYFGVAAGDFTLETLPLVKVGDRTVYHVLATARTSNLFNMFYRLDDSAETFIDYEGIFSHRFHIVLNETKQSRDSLELYDSEKLQTFYWNRLQRKGQAREETKEFKPIEPLPQDTLSSLYYLRTVPLPDGAVVTFPVVSEGNVVETTVRVLRREDLGTPAGRFHCVVLKPEAKTHGVLTKKGDSFMWLTDDDRRFLVRLEAKVKVGTIIAEIKKIELGIPPK